MADVYIANESGTVEIDGIPHNFIKGVTRASGDSAMYAAAGMFFDPVEDQVHYGGPAEVEQATAAPGEKRGARGGKAAKGE